MTTNPNDTRPTAHRLTVTPETMRQAEALGFEPGSGDVLLWALREVDRLQFAVSEFQKWSQAGPNGCPPYTSFLAGYLRQLDASFAVLRDIEERIRESRNTAWAERDTASRDLARIVRLYRDAVDHLEIAASFAVLRDIEDRIRKDRNEAEAERDAARRNLARIVQLCRDAVDHLEATAIQPYGALADRLRVEAGERPAGVICGHVVRERVSGNVITRALCPLPPGHDGDHAEALAGGD